MNLSENFKDAMDNYIHFEFKVCLKRSILEGGRVWITISRNVHDQNKKGFRGHYFNNYY